MVLFCCFFLQIVFVMFCCLFIFCLVFFFLYFEVDGLEIECSRVCLGNKRLVFFVIFLWFCFVVFCFVFCLIVFLIIFLLREIFERKVYVEVICWDFFLFVWLVVIVVILVVVDKLSLIGQWCVIILFLIKFFFERYFLVGYIQVFRIYCGWGCIVVSFVYLNILNFW